ncbi:Arrestin 2 [Operophtera brumata]|uniref:Arrestin 2 n=1 Tax=Operophtera brumata TaxID=104452 RepID=A0A0L7LP35_OPEBR|nr:Arrestin 2 [Operophtera brumata]
MVVAVKVFKKTTPNGKVTVYLGKRDFIDHMDYCDPIDGVVVVDAEYLKGRKVYSQLVTTYRYGREEDEVMGVKFSKEMVIGQEQVVPMINAKMELTPVQEKLLKKLGPNAYPFTFNFPDMAPSSVTLQPADEDQGKPMGVDYCVRTYVAEQEEQKSHKRSSVTLAIKKLQHAPTSRGRRLPSSLVSKGFTFSNGKINLEVTLDREIYYHGEKIAANVIVSNNSRKSVRNIRCMVVQHVEITMINSQFSRHVASMESREGCPVTPGASLSKSFYLVPLARSNKDIRGKCPADAIGIVVSYSVRVKLNCGTLGGELVTDVPFKLLHPAEGTIERQRFNAMKKMKSIERHRYENSLYTNEEEDNIVFEDFARLRMNEPE